MSNFHSSSRQPIAVPTLEQRLRVLQLLTNYIRAVEDYNTLATLNAPRTMELLKAFDSSTCQVVLSAGAMRSAGLKSSTAKHLGESPLLPVVVFVLRNEDEFCAGGLEALNHDDET